METVAIVLCVVAASFLVAVTLRAEIKRDTDAEERRQHLHG